MYLAGYRVALPHWVSVELEQLGLQAITLKGETAGATIRDAPGNGEYPPDVWNSVSHRRIVYHLLRLFGCLRIPELYREPLVLFHREHQSIEAVAQDLGLSEDAVKQRLSRGRKLLQEQLLAFVAGALKQTSPGGCFHYPTRPSTPPGRIGSTF